MSAKKVSSNIAKKISSNSAKLERLKLQSGVDLLKPISTRIYLYQRDALRLLAPHRGEWGRDSMGKLIREAIDLYLAAHAHELPRSAFADATAEHEREYEEDRQRQHLRYVRRQERRK